MERNGGRYLSWLLSRVAIGAWADTLLVVNLSKAKLTGYEPLPGNGGYDVAWEKELPVYFDAPTPREEIWTPSWIQIGGERPLLLEASHIDAIGFGPEGRIYAVRNYGIEWQHVKNRFVPTQGRWAVTQRGLEVYDRRGELLGTFSLPVERVSWIRVDSYGRVFMPNGAGSVFVIQDPFSTVRRCPQLPEKIHLSVVDTPPQVG